MYCAIPQLCSWRRSTVQLTKFSYIKQWHNLYTQGTHKPPFLAPPIPSLCHALLPLDKGHLSHVITSRFLGKFVLVLDMLEGERGLQWSLWFKAAHCPFSQQNMVLNWRWSWNRGIFILKIYKWCHWYPMLKCRELINRGVFNCRNHCTAYTVATLETAWFGPKGQYSVLNDLYFKTTCNIRPHFLRPMGGLKIEGPLQTKVHEVRHQLYHIPVVYLIPDGGPQAYQTPVWHIWVSQVGSTCRIQIVLQIGLLV